MLVPVLDQPGYRIEQFLAMFQNPAVKVCMAESAAVGILF